MGDTATSRPLVIYLHTGSFLPIMINGTATGYVRDSATVEMCKQFARRGYVAVSMDYRLGWNPIGATQDIRTGTLLQAVFRALQDAKTCVRYFKMTEANGNPHKIDSTRITLGGQGSGGYVVLAYASLDQVSETQLTKFIATTNDATYGFVAGQSYVNIPFMGDFDGLGGIPQLNLQNWPGHTNDVRMVFNMGGAMGDSSWMAPGDVPMVCFHVPNDPFAPYTYGPVIVPTTGQFVVFVSGSHDVVRKANQLGNNDVFNIPYNDPYTTRANQVGPWEWWSQTDLEAFAPLLGLSASAADTANVHSLVTNPDMSKTKAKHYIDSIQGYLAPRMVQANSLPGMYLGIIVCDCPTGNSLSSYPNPALDEFTLQLSDANEQMQFVEVYDATGKLVRNIQNLNSSSVQVAREGLSSGMYLLRIGLKSGVIEGKMMME
jgi:hypothetical protein